MLTKLRARFKRPIRFTTTLGEVRQSRGLTEEELAEYCEVSVETIRMIEAAKYEPSVVLASRLAQKLEVSVEELFVLTNEKNALRASEDERLQSTMYHYGFWLMFFLISGSLIAANVFLNMCSCYEDVGETLFAVWAVGAVLYLASTTAIPGYWRYSRSANRSGTTAKYRIGSSIASGIMFAVIMYLFDPGDKSVQGRILHATYNALFFGGLTYLTNYFQGRSKAKKQAAENPKD